MVDDGGEFGVDGGFAQHARAAKAGGAGEGVVGLEADAVEGDLPEGVGGDDEGLAADEVGCVAEHAAALFEGLKDELDVALLEVADAAVGELGGAAGGGLGEVGLLDEQGAVATGGGVDGRAEAGGAASDDEDVEGGVGLGAVERGGSVHREGLGIRDQGLGIRD